MPYLSCSSCGLRTYAVSEGTCPSCGTALRRRNPPAGPRPAGLDRDGQVRAKLAMACRELDADAALLSEVRGGREHVRWGAGEAGYVGVSVPLQRHGLRPPARRTDRQRRRRRHARGVAEPARGRHGRHDPRLHRRPVRDRGRARLRALLPRARGAAGSRARPTSASCRASPRACDRCSRLVRPLKLLLAALLLAGCGGGSAAAERRRRRPRAPPPTRPRPPPGRKHGEGAAVRLQKIGSFDSPVYVTVAAGRHEPRCSSSSRAGRSASSRTARRSTRRSSTSATRSSPAPSRACCRSPSRPTTRPAGSSTSSTPTRTATRRVVEYKRSSDDVADPGSARTLFTVAGPGAQPQRRPAAVRARQAPLHRDRRRRRRRRPARRARQRPEPRDAARQDPADRPEGERRQAVHDPVGQPVREPRRREARDLQLRPAQPVAVLVRPLDRRSRDRRRRPGRGRGDRLRAQGQGARRELRLAACSRATTATRRARARPVRSSR